MAIITEPKRTIYFKILLFVMLLREIKMFSRILCYFLFYLIRFFSSNDSLTLSQFKVEILRKTRKSSEMRMKILEIIFLPE